ncbi:molybdopterin molybdenumtransferase MoeA [Brachybacterium vulturis]|uniref:Molybdopterin molybdenumtransferase n=1 Tax=Brachybacterium vulturis TaxID=2017484 RepID=A0A291GR63_9MICO|nr:molybdopterin molybdotransferase MoeA [Brachybacterium vulturis]ATG52731.1 molybdopterin molybdenumtransferase MoeA [Brachybacterium vulturis]
MSDPRPDPQQWRDLLLREIVLPSAVEPVPTEQGCGRRLAAEVRSPEAMPSVPIAAMDGFAVRRGDLTVPGRTTLPVSAELPARPGAVPALAPGTAARIMTGAAVPLGADAVVEVEATDADPFGPVPAAVTLHLQQLPPAQRHVRAPGEEVARDELLAAAGDRVGPGLVGLARALGMATLPTCRRHRVSVVVTGDELTAGAESPGSVRESNGAMLAAALRAAGAEALAPLHSGDDHAGLRATLARAAADSDLVVTTGGIGHGAFDVVKTLLGERGSSTSRFAHLALRPGGPQGWGRLDGGVPVVHLPGTPVGALVGFHLFVRPLLAGGAAAVSTVLLGDTTADGARRRPGAVHAMAGRLRLGEDGRELVDLLPGRRLAPYGRADAIVLRGAPGTEDGWARVVRL